MALCESTMVMMILKKVVANAAEIISTLDDIQLKVSNAPRCLRSLMVNAKQVELGFPAEASKSNNCVTRAPLLYFIRS